MACNILFNQVKRPSFFIFFVSICMMIILAFGGWCLYRVLSYYQADQFSVSHIQSTLPFDPAWTIHPSPEEKAHADSLLNQPFFYLDKGSQCYVFESEDNSCVLKFFRHERYRVPKWISSLILPRFFEKLQKEKSFEKEEKRRHLFRSCLLAFQELREESGLIYLQLNKTSDFNRKVILYDKKGRCHEIAIDQYEFLLQKKANLIYPTLKKWVANGEIETAKQAISSMFAILLKRFQKSISDYDPVIRKNAGFIDSVCLYVDVGQFVIDEKMRKPQEYRKEICKIMKKFRQWLVVEAPELVEYVDNEISNFGVKDKYAPQDLAAP